MNELVAIISDVGFPIAVVIWLLYDKSKRDEKVVVALDRIMTTIDRLEERLESTGRI